MADDILINFIASSLRSKSQDSSALKASQIFYQASKSLHILDPSTQLSNELGEICTKAKNLVQSKNTTQKMAGLIILRSFVSEASCATFLQGFLEWANDAISILKSQDDNSLHHHAWQLLTSIFTRAGRVIHIPGVRRDSSTLVPKLVNLFKAADVIDNDDDNNNNDNNNDDDMITTLHAALSPFPAPFKQHIKSIEPFLLRRMYPNISSSSQSSSSSLSLHAASCYAMLSRSEGDAESWSTRLHNLLATIHTLLDVAYLGQEPPHHNHTACKASYKPGSHCIILDTNNTTNNNNTSNNKNSKTDTTNATTALSDLLSHSTESYTTAYSYLHTTLHSLLLIITTSHPFPVPLPIQSLFTLAERMLSVDADTLIGGASAGRLAQLQLSLSRLRCDAIMLIDRVLRVGGLCCVPYVVQIGRRVQQLLYRIRDAHHGRGSGSGSGSGNGGNNNTGKMKKNQHKQSNSNNNNNNNNTTTNSIQINQSATYRSVSIDERHAIYRLASRLVHIGGMSVVKLLCSAVVSCAHAELYHQVSTTMIDPGKSSITMYTASSSIGGNSNINTTTTTKEQQMNTTIHYDARATSIGADSHIAALTSQASFFSCLEALLIHGASMFTIKQRTVIDDLIARAASDIHSIACKARHDPDSDVSIINHVHCTAYKALLASVLAPAQHRPRYISLAMKLFSEDLHHQDGEIAMVCSHAMLCCESLMHPRSLLPTINSGGSHGGGGGGGQYGSMTHHINTVNTSNDDDDDDDDDGDKDIDAVLLEHIKAIPKISTLIDPGVDMKRAVVIAIEGLYSNNDNNNDNNNGDDNDDNNGRKRKSIEDEDNAIDVATTGTTNIIEKKSGAVAMVVEEQKERKNNNNDTLVNTAQNKKTRRDDNDDNTVPTTAISSFEEKAKKALAATMVEKKEEKTADQGIAVAASSIPHHGDDNDVSDSDISLPDIDSGDEDDD